MMLRICFLGAAFVAVGSVSAAFAVHRRKRESLLVNGEQDSTFYIRLRGSVNYVLLVLVFLFFISLGLSRRFERAVAYAMVRLRTGCDHISIWRCQPL